MTHARDQAPRTSLSRRRWIAMLLMAAAVAAIAPTIFRELKPLELPGASVLLATTAGNGIEDVDLILDHPVWGEFQGDGEGAIPPEARSIRLGAALADLELRYLRSDSSAGASVERVIQLLRSFPGSADAVRAFQSLGAGADRTARKAAAAAAERVANRRLVRLGSWLRSARFAAASADSTVFDVAAVRSATQAALTYDARPGTEYAVRQFEGIVRQRPHDWTALATGAEELLRLLGTR